MIAQAVLLLWMSLFLYLFTPRRYSLRDAQDYKYDALLSAVKILCMTSIVHAYILTRK